MPQAKNTYYCTRPQKLQVTHPAAKQLVELTKSTWLGLLQPLIEVAGSVHHDELQVISDGEPIDNCLGPYAQHNRLGLTSIPFQWQVETPVTVHAVPKRATMLIQRTGPESLGSAVLDDGLEFPSASHQFRRG